MQQGKPLHTEESKKFFRRAQTHIGRIEKRMRPRLDHYHGQFVERVDRTGGGIAIVLDSGARIGTEAPDSITADIEGMQFLGTALSGNRTVLHFGRVQDNLVVESVDVALTPTEYWITDPQQPAEGRHFPQRGGEETAEEVEIEEARPPDPSPDRDKGASDAERANGES